METIRDRFREIRLKLRLNQDEFAAKMGIKRNTYANLERGVNPCADRYINLLCLSYGVRREWLVNGAGDIFEPANPARAAETEGVCLPQDVAALVALYQELVPENQKDVMHFLERTLQAQRNTLKALNEKNKD